ncbi:unnamed protein product, partial [Trichobilharzia szidati]
YCLSFIPFSGSKRGRKSVMGLDLTNIIDSPPGSADSSGTRRRSLRLRRKSTCAVSHDEQTLPSRRYRRKSVIDPQTQWNIGLQARDLNFL